VFLPAKKETESFGGGEDSEYDGLYPNLCNKIQHEVGTHSELSA